MLIRVISLGREFDLYIANDVLILDENGKFTIPDCGKSIKLLASPQVTKNGLTYTNSLIARIVAINVVEQEGNDAVTCKPPLDFDLCAITMSGTRLLFVKVEQ